MNEINEPWQNKLFIGHQPIISQLDRLKNNNSLTNTLLFSGPIGIESALSHLDMLTIYFLIMPRLLLIISKLIILFSVKYQIIRTQIYIIYLMLMRMEAHLK